MTAATAFAERQDTQDLRDLLTAVLPHLAPWIADEGARQRVLSAAAAWPAVSGFGLECRMGHPNRLDLAVRFSAREHGLLPASLPAPPLPGMTLWLERDIPRHGPGGIGIFAGPGRGGNAILRPSFDICALGDWLYRGRMPAWARRFLAGAAASLPDPAWIAYLGRFPHRDPDALRVNLSAPTLGDLAEALATLGVPALPALPAGPEMRASASFDIRDGRAQSPALELAPLDAGCWPDCLARLAPFADLAPLGDALPLWRGASPHPRGFLARRLNHVKLGFCADEPRAAKAYFYIARIDGRHEGVKTWRP